MISRRRIFWSPVWLAGESQENSLNYNDFEEKIVCVFCLRAFHIICIGVLWWPFFLIVWFCSETFLFCCGSVSVTFLLLHSNRTIWVETQLTGKLYWRIWPGWAQSAVICGLSGKLSCVMIFSCLIQEPFQILVSWSTYLCMSLSLYTSLVLLQLLTGSTS